MFIAPIAQGIISPNPNKGEVAELVYRARFENGCVRQNSRHRGFKSYPLRHFHNGNGRAQTPAFLSSIFPITRS